MAGKYCKYCEKYVAVEQSYQPNHTVWALLSLCSCGIFVIPWAAAVVLSAVQGKSCRFCGNRV